MSILNVGTLITTDGVRLPNLSPGSRPADPVLGTTIYNTSSKNIETWNGSVWQSQSTSSVSATGGTEIIDGDFKVHIFTGDGNFNVVSSSPGAKVEVLVVAGGGGGGSYVGGGGGGGGLIYNAGVPVTSGTNYAITVGGGGSGGQSSSRADNETNGQNSSFGSLLIAIGGGRGRRYPDQPGIDGGSGGGAGGISSSSFRGILSGDGVPGQGNRGGYHIFQARTSSPTCGKGGGGAGGPGQDGDGRVRSNGGPGVAFNLTGTTYYWSGGGGGGGYYEGGGDGGIGGGGGGGRHVSGVIGTGGGSGYGGNNGSPGSGAGEGPGGNGGANTGGGGGGCGHSQWGGNGGSGIVIVRYLNAS